MGILNSERSYLKKVLKIFFLMALSLLPLMSFGQNRDTTYFNPLIDDIILRIPPLEDLIDSAIVHNPQIKYYDADIVEWRYRVKSASRVWLRNFYLDTYLQTDFWKSVTNNSLNYQAVPDNLNSFQNSYR